MKKVLVTGAAGYIGSHVVGALLDLGYEVIASDVTDRGIDPRAVACPCDIFSEENPYEALGKPDILIHMAWRDGFVHNSDKHMNDLPRHIEFIRRMVDAGVSQINVMGSMHEIGFYEGAIDENTPQNPSSMYGISKNALRQALFVLQKDKQFSLNWLRGYYICGDDSRNHSIFAKLLEKAEAGEKTFPFTTGVNQYDFLDVDHLGMEIALASVQTEISGIINCCSGKPVALKDKVEAFIAEKGLDIQLQYGVYPDRPYDSKIIYGDNRKIKQIVSAFLEKADGKSAEKAKALLADLA